MIFSSALPLNLGSASSACIFIAEEEAEEKHVIKIKLSAIHSPHHPAT